MTHYAVLRKPVGPIGKRRWKGDMAQMIVACQRGRRWGMWFMPPMDLAADASLKALFDELISYLRIER
jgi:hypothetical protein